MRVFVLLSPAKTLNWAPPPLLTSALWTEPAHLMEADPVIQVMRSKTKADLKKLMSVSDSIADLNHGRYQGFLSAEEAKCKAAQHRAEGDLFRPAALAYDGPAYRGLNAATFSEEDWMFSRGSVRLLSGLYGVLKPTDLIQPYRLEMGSKVSVAKSKDLYVYWREKVTQYLVEDAKEGPGPESSDTSLGKKFLVVNVASEEYSKAVDFQAIQEAGGKVVNCVFKDDGRVLSVFAKRARGLLARHVVLSRAEDVSDLLNFTAEGYRLDRAQSTDGVIVFTRTKGQRPTPQSQTTGKSSKSTSAAADSGKGKKRAAGARTRSESTKKVAKAAGRKSPAQSQPEEVKRKSSRKGKA